MKPRVCATYRFFPDVLGPSGGNLHASDRVELPARARIIGDIACLAMTMQADESNIPQEHAPLSAASGEQGYNPKLLIHKAGAFT
jgi:hypothetical protein